MGELEDRLESEDESRLSDAEALGRSQSTMSNVSLTEYAGAAYTAFNALEARVDAEDSLGTGELDNRLSTETKAILAAAGALGRSARILSKTELTEFAGSLYLSYEALAARIAALDANPAGTVMQDALETTDENKLSEAGGAGRSKLQLSAKEMSEWAGATKAVYASLEARVTAIEGAT